MVTMSNPNEVSGLITCWIQVVAAAEPQRSPMLQSDVSQEGATFKTLHAGQIISAVSLHSLLFCIFC